MVESNCRSDVKCWVCATIVSPCKCFISSWLLAMNFRIGYTKNTPSHMNMYQLLHASYKAYMIIDTTVENWMITLSLILHFAHWSHHFCSWNDYQNAAKSSHALPNYSAHDLQYQPKEFVSFRIGVAKRNLYLQQGQHSFYCLRSLCIGRQYLCLDCWRLYNSDWPLHHWNEDKHSFLRRGTAWEMNGLCTTAHYA